MTINEALALVKIAKERLRELKDLRDKVSTRTITSYDGKETTIEPEYDVKQVDKKIAEIETFLFEADSKIKKANATTEVSIEYSVGSLLQPLQ